MEKQPIKMHQINTIYSQKGNSGGEYHGKFISGKDQELHQYKKYSLLTLY